MSKQRHEWLMLMAELAMERLNRQSCAVYQVWLDHAGHVYPDRDQYWAAYDALPQ